MRSKQAYISFLVGLITTVLTGQLNAQPPWDFQPTGDVHTIQVEGNVTPQVSGEAIAENDVIGVFYDSAGKDYCAGYKYWNDTSSAQQIKAYGQASGYGGFMVGDSVQFKIWDRDRDCIIENLKVSYNPNNNFPDSFEFRVNGDSRVSKMNGKKGIVRYPRGGYCQDANDPEPVLRHLDSSVAFESSAGLSLDENTGSIDLDQSNPGIYEVEFTTQKYKTELCLASFQDSIHIKEEPKVDLGEDRSFCAGDTVILDPNEDYNLSEWGNDRNDDPISNKPVFKVTEPGTYWLIARSIDGCINRDTVTINEIQAPDISLPDTVKACQSAELAIDVNKAIDKVNWSNQADGQNTQISETGNYNVAVTDTFGCESTDSSFVSISKTMNLNRLDPQTEPSGCEPSGQIKVDEPAKDLIEGGIAPYKYKLIPKTNGFSETSDQLAFENLKPATYRLEVEDQYGCKASLPQALKVERKDCEDPVITPNGDGNADSYRIPYEGTAKIYDKKGRLQRELSIPNEWRGRDEQGNKVPMGTYLIVCNGNQEILITVLR